MPDSVAAAASKYWWVSTDPSSQEAFVLATLIGTVADGSIRLQITPHGERICRPEVNAWPATSSGTEASDEPPADLCASEALHMPALLHTVRRRYEECAEYGTWLGASSLLWLNPCGPTPEMFTAQRKLRAAASAVAPPGEETSAEALSEDPHPYTLAEQSLRAALNLNADSRGPAAAHSAAAGRQPVGAVLLHGETGGGQCGVFVEIASYWLWRCSDPFGAAAATASRGGTGSADTRGAVGEAASILARGEIVLHAFGSARTRRHSSTPRFGRWLRVVMDARGSATSVTLSTFALQTSRVVNCSGEPDGNFHAYYAVLHLASLRYYASTGAATGAPPRSRDGCAPPCEFAMLNSDVTVAEGAHRSADDLARLREALGLGGLGCSGREVTHLWCLLEGILHLGNLDFTDSETDTESADSQRTEARSDPRKGGGYSEKSKHGAYDDVTVDAQEAEIEACSTLLGLPKLKSLLLQGEAAAHEGPLDGTILFRHSAIEASKVRHAFMEELHGAIFAILVAKLNSALARAVARTQALPTSHTVHRTGAGSAKVDNPAISSKGAASELLLLAPPPAEALPVNGLAQLLANYASERMRALFISRVLAAEQRRYEDEAISWVEVPVPETQGVLSLLDGRADSHDVTLVGDSRVAPAKGSAGTGVPILTMLDSLSRRTTNASAENAAAAFCVKLQRVHAGSTALSAAAPDGDGAGPAPTGETFVIRHFVGALVYDARALLAGSRSASLSRHCRIALLESSNLLLKQIGDSYLSPAGACGVACSAASGCIAAGPGSSAAASRRVARSTVASFTAELRSVLQACEAGAVRHALCIAPNATEVPSCFEPRFVVRQRPCALLHDHDDNVVATLVDCAVRLDGMGVPAVAYFLANVYQEVLPLLLVTGKLRGVAPSAWAHLAPRAFVHKLLVACNLHYGRHFQIGRTAALVRTQARWGGAQACNVLLRILHLPEPAARAELARLHANAARRQLDATLLFAVHARRWIARHRGRHLHGAERAKKRLRASYHRNPTKPPMAMHAPPARRELQQSGTSHTHSFGQRNRSAVEGAPGAANMEEASNTPLAAGHDTITLGGLEALAETAIRSCAACPPEWARDAPLGHARVVLVQQSSSHILHAHPPEYDSQPAWGSPTSCDAPSLSAPAFGLSALRAVSRAFSFGRRSSRRSSRAGSVSNADAGRSQQQGRVGHFALLGESPAVWGGRSSLNAPSPPASPPSAENLDSRSSVRKGWLESTASWTVSVANGVLDAITGPPSPQRRRSDHASINRHRSGAGSQHDPRDAPDDPYWKDEDERFHQALLAHTDMRRHHYKRLQQGRAPPSQHDYAGYASRSESMAGSPHEQIVDGRSTAQHHRRHSRRAHHVEANASREVWRRAGSSVAAQSNYPRSDNPVSPSLHAGEQIVDTTGAGSRAFTQYQDSGIDASMMVRRELADATTPIPVSLAPFASPSDDQITGAVRVREPACNCESAGPAAVGGEAELGHCGSRGRSSSEAALIHSVSATLRNWQQPVLNATQLPQLVSLPDAAKAVALGSLLRTRTLASLVLHDCRLGERSAICIGELLSAAIPIASLDLRNNAIGEPGLVAIAAGLQAGGSLTTLRIQRALPAPLSPSAIDALAAAAKRCRALREVWLGETDAAAASNNGPLARLQYALILNVEDGASAVLPRYAWGHKPSASTRHPLSPSPPPSPPSPGLYDAPSTEGIPPDDPKSADADGDGLSAAIDALRRSRLRTLRLAHEPSAAHATLPRQLELLRSLTSCASLRVAQLVNVGLGDAWGHALAAALPRLRALRVLDITHNYVGGAAARDVVDALRRNHSLLWLQLMPQWLPLDRDIEQTLASALSSRRFKVDLAMRGAQGVLAARGDLGDPAVLFEWRGAVFSTGRAQLATTTQNPKWDEHFTICAPATLLWPPSRTPLTLNIVDLRRSAQLASDAPMGMCELPLGALLLSEVSVDVQCSLKQFAPAVTEAARSGATLHVSMNTVHVGGAQPDDEAPGVPQAWTIVLAEERRAEFDAAVRVQAGWRRRGNDRRQRSRGSVKQVAEHALASNFGGRFCLACSRCRWWLTLGATGRASPPREVAVSDKPLLPMYFDRSDDVRIDGALSDVMADSYSDSDDEAAWFEWRRRVDLLRATLCLLCSSICVLSAAAGLLLLYLKAGISNSAVPM